MKIGQIKRPLLFFCIGISTLIHISAVCILYLNPFYFESETTSAIMKPSSSPITAIQKDSDFLIKKMEEALEESFNMAVAMTSPDENEESLVLNNSSAQTSDSKEKVNTPVNKILFACSPAIRKKEMELLNSKEVTFSANMPPLFDPNYEEEFSEFCLDKEAIDPTYAFENKIVTSIDFNKNPLQTDYLSKMEVVQDDYTMTENQFSPSSLPIYVGNELAPDFIASLKELKISKKASFANEMNEEMMFSTLKENAATKLILPNSVDYLRDKWIKRSIAEGELPDLDSYGINDMAMSFEWEEDLSVDVALMPARSSNQYVFSITVHPDFALNTPKMKQNFYFAIDHSNSTERQKFSRYKRAVQRSLAALHEGDSFNIYIFDKKLSKLSKNSLPVSPKTIMMAEEFLENQLSRAHSASDEVFRSLEEMLPNQYAPNELHSVILVSDGSTLLNSNQQKQSIARWLEKHEGLVNIYTAASGRGNNLVVLDVLSYLTAGKLLYSDTNAGLPRKLVRLVKDLHNPIVKDLTIDVQAKDSQARVTLYPRKNQLPPMFAEKSYTLVGTIDELCDLTLHIQGRNHERWLNIRKDINFESGAIQSRSLEKAWATTQSRICYDHYLKNGKKDHLNEAIKIVTPYRGVIASEQ